MYDDELVVADLSVGHWCTLIALQTLHYYPLGTGEGTVGFSYCPPCLAALYCKRNFELRYI